MQTSDSTANREDTWMENVLFLQVDLANHTEWMLEEDSRTEKAQARIRFAKRLTQELEKNGFERLHWLGDGGLFAFKDKLTSCDRVVDASDTAFEVFQDWKDESDDRTILQLRVSAHLAANVYRHHDPSYWFSEDLNVFAKYERDIAVDGTTAITSSVRQNMSEVIQRRFPEQAKRQDLLSDRGRGLIRYVYYDAKHPVLTFKNIPSLPSFLAELSSGSSGDDGKQVGPSSYVRATLGESVVLWGAASPQQRMTVDLKKLVAPSSYDKREDREPVNWKRVRSKYPRLTKDFWSKIAEGAKTLRTVSFESGQPDNLKVSPTKLVFPLSDMPLVTIEFVEEHWSIARTFQDVLAQDFAVADPQTGGRVVDSIWQSLARNAADVQVQGLGYPGILCMHILCRCRSGQNDANYLLLCQRNKGGRPDFFHPGLWSCSIEEQIKPSERIETCVRRGIAEELLGPLEAERLDVSVVGAFLERAFLNLTLLVVVDIPLSYDEIHALWVRGPVDKYEHMQIVALPLEADAITECIESGELTSHAREACIVADETVFHQEDFPGGKALWSLHPTSPLRMATALWLEMNAVA